MNALNSGVSRSFIGEALRKSSEGIAKGEFPLEDFPEKMRELILYLVEVRDFKLEYIASALLTVAAVAIGNSRHVRVRENWHLAPMFYMIFVGRPGIGKSPPFGFAFKPIMDLECERTKAYRAARKEYERLKMEYDKGKSEGTPPEEPVLVRTVISDSTQEAMMKIHAGNHRGICYRYDEIIGFFKTVNRYNASSLIENLLSMFSGEPIISSRKDQNESVTIASPCVSLIGTTQTSLLPQFAKYDIFDNGLFDRFLLVTPFDRSVPKWSQQKMDTQCYDAEGVWKDIVGKLMNLQMQVDTETSESVPVVLNLSESANNCLMAWHNDNADIQNMIDDDNMINTRMAKWDYQVPRLALVMQLLYWACGEGEETKVDVIALQAAIRLNSFYEQCYSALSAELDKAAPTDKRESWFAILPESFTTRYALDAGLACKISSRTVKEYLRKCLEEGILAKPSHGHYRKT